MNDNFGLKTPPMSIEAEQAVLGGLMLDSNAIETVLDICGEEDFYRRDHREIFAAILKCDERGDPFDTISLAETLKNSNQLDDVGGFPYLSSLISNTPSASNIKTYARVVKDKSVERQLLQASNQIADIVYNEQGLNTQEKVDATGSLLINLIDDKSRTGPQRVSDALNGWVIELDERFNAGGSIVGLSTGFMDIDKRTSGMNKSDLIILAARPAQGKSSLAMNIAENVSVINEIPAAFFSLEMPTNQLINRMVASIGHVDHERIRTGQLHDDEWPRVTSAAARIKNAPLFIDDSGGLTPTEIRNRARRLKRQEGIELIVIDYLQLIRVKGKENRTQEIGEISWALKSLAKELNIPVVCLSQLNRSLESRADKRPIMSDLRESGAIEQDADVIAFIYRDEVYNPDSADKGTAEVIFRKQRNGPVGTTRLAFDGSQSRFASLVYEPQ